MPYDPSMLARISAPEINLILDELIQNELVIENQTSRSSKTYTITSKGIKLINRLKKIQRDYTLKFIMFHALDEDTTPRFY